MPNIAGIPVSQDVADLYYEAHPDEAEINKVKTLPASKYHNTRQDFAGLRFASGHEVAVCSGLMLEEKQGVVFGLRFRVRFTLPGGNIYESDATGLELVDHLLVPRVWDAKGMRTKEYLVKKRAFKAEYGLEITEL